MQRKNFLKSVLGLALLPLTNIPEFVTKPFEQTGPKYLPSVDGKTPEALFNELNTNNAKTVTAKKFYYAYYCVREGTIKIIGNCNEI